MGGVGVSAYLSLIGRRRGGRLFEAGRLLTFSAFKMGAYSRWALIRGWALIRINTVRRTGLGWKQRGAERRLLFSVAKRGMKNKFKRQKTKQNKWVMKPELAISSIFAHQLGPCSSHSCWFFTVVILKYIKLNEIKLIDYKFLITVKPGKQWKPEIFLECYSVARKKPIRREKTESPARSLISLWFCGQLTWHDLCRDWS